MFKFAITSFFIASAGAFNPLGSATMGRMQMTVEKPASVSKIVGAAIVASSIISSPVFAKEGAGAKISVFGDADISSPFAAAENREDPIYSPYSPYGNGEKAVYNARRGSPEELKFWQAQFAECVKRTEKIPSYADKKTWFEITTELTRYNYNFREAMNRLAEASKSPKAASAAAKAYFDDLNDVFVFATKKNGPVVQASYEKSVKDLASFKALL
mmetsp:Transcript_21375/g.29409  ORF Transcript_21375/g.29409 Transcript_21375/m.29409 type:complete len:215 (-) Transcript_21375:144-788(-)